MCVDWQALVLSATFSPSHLALAQHCVHGTATVPVGQSGLVWASCVKCIEMKTIDTFASRSRVCVCDAQVWEGMKTKSETAVRSYMRSVDFRQPSEACCTHCRQEAQELFVQRCRSKCFCQKGPCSLS